jgi:N-acylneuraminate cytidylyltransferase
MFWPEYSRSRSNDLATGYHCAGQFYWGNTEKFLKEKELFSSDSFPVILPRHLVHDIDVPEDWDIAEQFYIALGNQYTNPKKCLKH